MRVSVQVCAGTASIQVGALPRIYFFSDDIQTEDTGPHDFALWAILPVLMRENTAAVLDFPVSRSALESTLSVARIWSKWCPEIFSVPSISTNIVNAKSPTDTRHLFFFSGGIDSTYSAHILQGEALDPDCLTVHGMDYKYDDLDRFDALMQQTERFRRKHFKRSLSVRTNIYSVYELVGCNPFDGHITHIFALFASGSLFKQYTHYYIAADYRLDQQFMVHPYGSNSATNRKMSNGNGRLITCNDDISRAEKAGALAASGVDLSSLSICTNYEKRPNNCGQCSKCIRTKVMFYATSNSIPDIFENKEIPREWFRAIDVRRKIDRVFLGNILDTIAVTELKTELNYDGAFEYWLVAATRARQAKSFRKSARDFIEKILPKSVIKFLKWARSFA